MTSNRSGKATTVVIVMEPGWVYVKVAEPKPEPDQIELLLRHTIDNWFGARPTYVIDKAEAITDQGVMLGIHVWYHEVQEALERTPKVPTASMDTFSIESHHKLAQQFSREYLEAVLDDALKILPSYMDRQDTLVVINRRRVVVILDKLAHKGALLPLDLAQQVVGGKLRATLEEWLSNPPAPFFVTHIAGSWFEPHNEQY